MSWMNRLIESRESIDLKSVFFNQIFASFHEMMKNQNFFPYLYEEYNRVDQHPWRLYKERKIIKQLKFKINKFH